MPLMGSLLDWTWLRKESVNLKRCQQKLTKQKKAEKDRTEYPRTMGQLQKM